MSRSGFVTTAQKRGHLERYEELSPVARLSVGFKIYSKSRVNRLKNYGGVNFTKKIKLCVQAVQYWITLNILRYGFDKTVECTYWDVKPGSRKDSIHCTY